VTILYVETNFLVGIATGRDRESTDVLARVGPCLTLLIPSVCLFESLAWMESEFKRRESFHRSMAEQITQLDRDRTSSHAFSLSGLLRQSLVLNNHLKISVDSRLHQAIADLTRVSGLIDLNPSILEQSRNSPIINELTDNLILHCILDRARTIPSEAKLFLSGNTKDFGSEAVRKALREVGVQYFAETGNLRDWLSAVHPS